MRRRLSAFETRVLPRGWFDALRQIGLLAAVYILYQVVRGLIAVGNPYKPFGDALKIINFERTLHVFVEPSVQAWTSGVHWLMDAADWAYLYSHYVVTAGVIVFIYLRRNHAFYFVRNVFMVSMLIALVGYAVFPTAPPALMPEWGFTDAISQFLGVPHVDSGPASAFVNIYAAVPSMHVCFAVMTGGSMTMLVRRRWAKIAWALYPLWITFVVVATGNHYFTDVILGALTAAASAVVAKHLLARARPDVWSFRQATVTSNGGADRDRARPTGPPAPRPSAA